MSILSELGPPKGAKRPRKRIGRGPGSGRGKTAGKGHKGQNARANPGIRPRFEGGQTPLQRRLPKRGFTNIFKKEFSLVQVHDLARFEAGADVTPETLAEAGLVGKDIKDGVKILGKAELGTALKVRVHKVTQGAAATIEAAGGSVELIPVKPRGPGPKRSKAERAAEAQQR